MNWTAKEVNIIILCQDSRDLLIFKPKREKLTGAKKLHYFIMYVKMLWIVGYLSI